MFLADTVAKVLIGIFCVLLLVNFVLGAVYHFRKTPAQRLAVAWMATVWAGGMSIIHVILFLPNLKEAEVKIVAADQGANAPAHAGGKAIFSDAQVPPVLLGFFLTMVVFTYIMYLRYESAGTAKVIEEYLAKVVSGEISDIPESVKIAFQGGKPR